MNRRTREAASAEAEESQLDSLVAMSPSEKGAAFAELSLANKRKLFPMLPPADQGRVLAACPAADRSALLGEMSAAQRKAMLDAMPAKVSAFFFPSLLCFLLALFFFLQAPLFSPPCPPS